MTRYYGRFHCGAHETWPISVIRFSVAPPKRQQILKATRSISTTSPPPPKKKKYPFFFFLFFLSFCMKMNRKTLQGTVEAIVSDDAAKFNAEFNCGRRRDGDRSPPITRWRHQRRRPNSKRSRPPRWMSSRNVQRLPEIQFFKKNKNEIKKNTNKNETQILPPRRI